MQDRIWFQKYRIIKSLGRGGSAQVYLAEHIKLKTLRAIKQISKDAVLHEQLLNEAHILKSLKHSGIPVIYDFEEDAHNSYIIEQYIEGESLKAFRQKCRLLKENLIINFAVQICDLLLYLYSLDNPILYLDLKPENIIIADNVIKLIDFGASGFKNELNNRKFSLGTRGYAAPELYTGHIPDERTDIYGIGSILYYMAAGTVYDRKLSEKSRRKLLRHCSKSMQHIIYHCLRYNAVLRYSSVIVVKNKLLGINHRNQTGNFNGRESIRIAIAGTQPRIGVTHLALLITTYLNKTGSDAFYMERNDSDQIIKTLGRYQNRKTADGFYRLHNCNIIPGQAADILPVKDNFPVAIMDYGRINNSNMEDFKRADIRLIVAGGRDWELEATEETLCLLKGESKIRYLFNFINGNQFRTIVKHMEGLDCGRIPYEPDVFFWKKNKYLEDFIRNLLNY